MEKKKIILQVCDVKDSLAENKTVSSRPEFWLLQFIPKPQKMELIIRQAVEAGVSVIVPVIGEYTQKGAEKGLVQKSLSNDGKQNRISRIIKEARQQSGSPVETKVFYSVSVEEACGFWSSLQAEHKAALVLYERSDGTKSIYNALKNADVIKKENAKIAVAVGAEGGISVQEISIMKESGFIPVHFDTNILRCETASLYGIAALQTVLNGE